MYIIFKESARDLAVLKGTLFENEHPIDIVYRFVLYIVRITTIRYLSLNII